MAQRYAQELGNELPEVDAVVGFEKYSDIGPRIEEIITKSGYTMPTVQVNFKGILQKLRRNAFEAHVKLRYAVDLNAHVC